MVGILKDSYKKFLTNSDSRRGWVDYARGIAIILVVYKHILLGFIPVNVFASHYIYFAQEFFYNLRMPLFFIVAGLFIRRSVSRRSPGEFTKYKFSTILYPYLIWAFIHLTLKILAGNYINFSLEVSDYIDILIKPRTIDHFWYLYTLFVVIMIFAILYWLFRANKVLLMVIGILAYGVSFFEFNDYFALNDVLFYVLFLFIGDILSPYLMTDNGEKILSSWRTFMILLPFFIISQYHWLEDLSGVIRLTELTGWDRILCIPMTLLGCIFLLNISSLLSRYGAFKMLQYVGKHSLYIYIMHIMVIGLMRGILINTALASHANVFFFIMLFISVFLPIIAYLTIRKLGMWYLFTLSKESGGDRS